MISDETNREISLNINFFKVYKMGLLNNKRCIRFEFKSWICSYHRQSERGHLFEYRELRVVPSRLGTWIP